MTGKRWLLIFSIIIFLTGSFLTQVAHSQILEVTVTVEGLACPFCAYGIEKKLKRVEGVRSIDIGMNRGVVILTAEKGRSVDIGQIPRAVKDAGFSFSQMKARVTGTARREGEKFLLQYGGSDELFIVVDMKTDREKQFSEYIESGKTVEAEGIIQEGPEGAWTLFPESLKGASP